LRFHLVLVKSMAVPRNAVMTDAIDAFDWAATPLGPKADWTAELRTTVALCLGANYPSAVYWGPDWRMLHNDAALLVLRNDMQVLGQSAAKVWGKWWPEMEKAFAHISRTGSGITETNRNFHIRDGNIRRDTFWNYNFSPVTDASGNVVGIFAGARESTEEVLRARADALMVALDDQLAVAASINTMTEAALALIGERLSAQRSGFAEIDTVTQTLDIRRCWTAGTLPNISGHYPLGTFGSLTAELATGHSVVIDDNRTDPRTSDPVMLERYERIGLRSGIVVPILDRGIYVGGVFVQDSAPRRWLPYEIDLAEAATRRLWQALVRTRADIALRESEQRYRLIFEQAEDIIFTADIDQRITDANEAGARAIGLTRDTLIGRSIADFVDAEGFAQTSSMLQQKLDHGGNTRHEVPVLSADGRRMRWENNSTLIVDPDKRPIGLLSISRDVTERRAFEERRELLIHELNHRVKNTLALVQAIAHQSFRGRADSATAQANFMARIGTLAGAHDLLTREQWEGVTLAELVRAATAPLDATRIDATGDALAVTPKAAVALAMALHELGTNAVKYGALSAPDGRVGIVWKIEGDRLQLDWREWGGPPVAAPHHRGFGVKMIERALASDLGGRVTVDFARNGVRCIIDAPRKGNVT
jgi:PAS domain S-box-containing protein